MNDEKMYSADEICKELKITHWTLTNWYAWEKKLGLSDLPQPIVLEHAKGKPRRWTEDMLNQLQEFKTNIVVGRNGKFGEFTNPKHKNSPHKI